jgi:hypothetical protein
VAVLLFYAMMRGVDEVLQMQKAWAFENVFTHVMPSLQHFYTGQVRA